MGNAPHWSDLHSAGFALDPEYNFESYSQSTNEEVMSGFCNVLEKFYSDDVEKQSLALHQLSQFRQANGIFSSKMFDWLRTIFLLTTFYVFLTGHLKKRKKSCFLKSEKNVKYVFSNTIVSVAVQVSLYRRYFLRIAASIANILFQPNSRSWWAIGPSY